MPNRSSIFTTLLALVLLLVSGIAAAVPEIQHWRTANGVPVYFIPARELPMVDAQILFNAGSARDGDKPGLARLTNALLEEGAGDWSADDIADRLDRVGAQFSASSARDSAVISLRSLTDQARLWTALGRNELQVVSTDHCPFSSADKALGLDDFSRIPGGVPSIESRFALMYTYGVLANCFSLKRWVRMCCTNPARLFGLTHKGVIAIGYDADLVVFDPNKQVTLGTDVLHENVDWTPYTGFEVTGWPAVTISRGEVIVEDGTFYGTAGRGKFVERQLSM